RLIYLSCNFFSRAASKLRINNRFISCLHLGWDEKIDLDNPTNRFLFRSHFSFVQGWLFRAPDLLQKYRDQIINYFKLTEKHRNNIDVLIAVARKDIDILVGIHIRQGDYKIFENGKYYYSVEQYA